jgi:hypothetical protein
VTRVNAGKGAQVKRTGTLGLVGLVAVLALGVVSAPAQAKVKKVKVATEAVIDDVDVDLGESLTFTGHVTCEKAKCRRQRNVSLSETGTGTDAGSDRTDAAGDWEIVVDWDVIAGGSFVATAAKRTVKKRRHGEVKKIFKCLADSSEPYLIVT